MVDPNWAASLVSSAAITAVFAAIGFNRPSWSRSYTTAARYRTAIAAHIALYLLVLLVFYAVLRRGFADYAQLVGSAAPTSPSTLVWVALGLTLCVRALPTLSARLRTWLQRRAGIPSHAHRFAKWLADAEFEPAPPVRDEARAMLQARGIATDRDWLPLAQPAQRQLLKATELFIQLRQWEVERRFAGFAGEAKNDFDQLRHRFDRLSFRVARMFATLERLGEVRHQFTQQGVPSDRLDDLLRRIVGDLISDSCEGIGAFYDEACLLAARGTMATQASRKGRDVLISGLGFTVHREAPAAYGVLAYAAVLLYAGIWLFFLILPADDTAIGLKALVTVITLNVFGSMAIAIVPKLHWGFANAGLHERTPVRFVVGAGVCAMLFAVAVNLGAGALLLGGAAGALQRLREGSPYLHAAFLTAATMAWLVQDHRWRNTPSARTRRLRDAATLGAVWLLSSVVGRLLRPDPQAETLEMLQAALGSFVFGGVLGYVIPEAVRVDDVGAARRNAAAAPPPFATPTARQAAT